MAGVPPVWVASQGPSLHDELRGKVHQSVRPLHGCGHGFEFCAETGNVRVQIVHFLGKLRVQREDLSVCQLQL